MTVTAAASVPAAPWYLRLDNISQIDSALFAVIGFPAAVWQIQTAQLRYTHEELRS